MTGAIPASTAKRWSAGVRVRPENCEEYDTGSSVLFCTAHAVTNPFGEFRLNVVERVDEPDSDAASDSLDDFFPD